MWAPVWVDGFTLHLRRMQADIRPAAQLGVWFLLVCFVAK